MNKLNILVTGGAGYVGRMFVRQYKHKYNLTVFDNLLYADDYMEPEPNFIFGDVSDLELMKRTLPRFDVVIHLAGIVGDAACALRPDATKKANIDSVEILRDYFGGKIVYPSSCSVYGASDELLTEESALNPLSLYAETKIMSEEILKNKNAICLRLGTLHGISERPRFDIVVNTLAIRALITKKISVFGGNQWRPLLGLYDLIEALDGVLISDLTGIYNIASENLRITDIANKVIKAIPGTEVDITNTKFEDNRNYRISWDKLSREGFQAHHLVEDTIEDIKVLYVQKRVKDYGNFRYSNIAKLNFDWK